MKRVRLIFQMMISTPFHHKFWTMWLHNGSLQQGPQQYHVTIRSPTQRWPTQTKQFQQSNYGEDRPALGPPPTFNILNTLFPLLAAAKKPVSCERLDPMTSLCQLKEIWKALNVQEFGVVTDPKSTIEPTSHGKKLGHKSNSWSAQISYNQPSHASSWSLWTCGGPGH
jgi:hypothetical protein